jgi:hypothetical protein
LQTEKELDINYFTKAIEANNKQKSISLIKTIKDDAIKNIVDLICSK